MNSRVLTKEELANLRSRFGKGTEGLHVVLALEELISLREREEKMREALLELRSAGLLDFSVDIDAIAAPFAGEEEGK